MASSSSLSSYSSNLFNPSRNHIINTHHRPFLVSALSRRDEGIVEANLSVLKERISQVRMKEKLEKCCRNKNQNGWNYECGYNYNLKRKQSHISQFYNVLGLGFGTFGITCLSCTLFLYIVSLIIHLNL